MWWAFVGVLIFCGSLDLSILLVLLLEGAFG
jgi:hypothetical protein